MRASTSRSRALLSRKRRKRSPRKRGTCLLVPSLQSLPSRVLSGSSASGDGFFQPHQKRAQSCYSRCSYSNELARELEEAYFAACAYLRHQRPGLRHQVHANPEAFFSFQKRSVLVFFSCTHYSESQTKVCLDRVQRRYHRCLGRGARECRCFIWFSVKFVNSCPACEDKSGALCHPSYYRSRTWRGSLRFLQLCKQTVLDIPQSIEHHRDVVIQR
jgi:hypothetical protein